MSMLNPFLSPYQHYFYSVFNEAKIRKHVLLTSSYFQHMSVSIMGTTLIFTILGEEFSTAFSAVTALCRKLPFNCGDPPERVIGLRLWGEARIPYGRGFTRSVCWVRSSDWNMKKNIIRKLIHSIKNCDS